MGKPTSVRIEYAQRNKNGQQLRVPTDVLNDTDMRIARQSSLVREDITIKLPVKLLAEYALARPARWG